MISKRKIVSGSFLISGTTIGAGMLGIPLVTGGSGFVPGIAITSLVWLFMFCTGLLFLEATLWMPDGSNVLSMAGRFFGRGGKVFSGIMFAFLYYCLMVAYFAAGAPLLSGAITAITEVTYSGFWPYLIFTALFGTIVAVGPKSIDRANLILTIGMITSWFMLIGIGLEEVQLPRLKASNWPLAITAIPVLFSAFGFHNIIPSLTTYLKRDVRALRLSILFGTLIPLVVYIVWQWLIIGSLSQETIQATLARNEPITSAFVSETGRSTMMYIGRFFAFFAIVTSTLGVSFSMVDFIGDGLNASRKGLSRLGLTLLTFLPPFIFVSLNPHIFDTALGVAGGFGEAFLNGLLPVALVWAGRYRSNLTSEKPLQGGRLLLFLLTVLSLFVIALEAHHLWTSSTG